MKVTPVTHLHPLDLEEIVLGALLTNSEAIHLVSSMLMPENFCVVTHQIIFEGMIDCYSKSIPIDIMTVMETLRKAGSLDKIGGTTYLLGLTNRVASAANIEHHCRIIKQCWGMRKMLRVGQDITQKATASNGDFFELIDELELEVTSIKDNILTGSNRTIYNVIKSTIQSIESVDPNQAMGGIPLTGIEAFDRKLGGAEENDFIIFAGRPSMGKSSLVNNVLVSACMNKTPVLMWSLEMSSEETIKRLASALSSIPLTKIRNNNLTQEEWRILYDTFEQINNFPIEIQDKAGITVTDFRSKIIMLKRTKGLRIAILDRIGLLKFLDERGNVVQELEKITKLLRRTAKETGVTIIALNQLNRSVESRGGLKIPALSDLRNSGSIEQDATKVVMLYRPEYYDIAEDENGNSTAGVAILLIEKNTFGETGRVKCRFDADRTRFLNEEKYQVL